MFTSTYDIRCDRCQKSQLKVEHLWMVENVRMKHKTKLSVVTAVYNNEEYLAQSIESVLKQEYDNFELILVDDGSSDQSGEICDYYASRDDRIKVIHKNNGGVVSARKEGVEHSCGEYVAFVDADDWISTKWFIEGMMIVSQDAEIEVLHMNSFVMVRNSLENVITGGIRKGYLREKQICELFMNETEKGKLLIPGCMYIYRKDVIDNILPQIDNRIIMGEDLLTLAMVADFVKVMYVIQEHGYYYRQHDNSVTHRNDLQKLSGYRIVFEKMNSLICGKLRQEILLKIKLFVFYSLFTQKPDIFIENNKIIPYMIKGRRLSVVGAGVFGKNLVRALLKSDYYEVVGWYDKRIINNDDICKTVRVDLTKNIKDDADEIIIAISKNSYGMYNEAKSELLQLGIPEKRIAELDYDVIFNMDLGYYLDIALSLK